MEMSAIKVKLTGTVTPFRGNGRTLGYPTANIISGTPLQDGVYFGFASLGKYQHHPALIFIGTPTTVGDTERRAEAHLLDIEDKDYYDKQLTVLVRHYHRPNQTFASVDDLLAEMKRDEAAARAWFAGQHLVNKSKV